ncbi:MAG TPA: PAS domain-containing protein [Polyangiaceae bacterium]|nr:PAS domain-containing protein [Polyangiaceae bacterium]
MSEYRAEDGDPLARWLAGPGLSALDALTGGALDVIGVMDRDLTVRYLNWAAAGMKREQLIGTSTLDLAPPDCREAARQAYMKVLQTGVGERLEMMFRAGNTVLLWDVRIGPIRSGDQVIGLIAISTDVTEQRSAYADRDRFFSLSLDMLAVMTAEGLFKRANPAFGQTLGCDVAELIGTPFIELVHPDDRAPTLEAYEVVRSGIPVSNFENRYRCKDGEYRVFSWRAKVDPVTDDVYAVARDVTDHRATEFQLRHAQKMEAVGQLAGGVAHDFNNLLFAILANTGLAQDLTSGAPEIADHLAEIEAATLRAADLTKQLLAFSRRQPLRPVPVDLNERVRGLMKMLRRLLPESISIDLIPGHNLPSVNADPGQLEQVIVNLCVNARDAMERGGHLTIETETVLINARYCESHPWAKPGRYVLLSVTDTGVGMTAEVRERAFEPFFTTKGPHQGTGLGLSTVYGIVQQHDGMVHLYSEPGAGTTFKVYLPAHARPVQSVGNKLAPLPPRGQETILLAEDEEQVRGAVVQILQRAGYRTIAAANGLDAIALLRDGTEPVHLVLLDVVMPGLGGPETWEQMVGLRPGLRVLFSSGYADDRYRQLLPAGAVLLEKPFRAEDLLRRVRQLLDQSPEP